MADVHCACKTRQILYDAMDNIQCKIPCVDNADEKVHGKPIL